MSQLFLDCDGVLADFDKKAEEIFGMHPRKFEELHGSKAFWKGLYQVEDIFFTFEPKHDAFDLFEGVKHLDPIILTGKPRGGWAEGQKLRWRDKHFPNVPMICCESKNKFLHMTGPGDVIIDDWHKYKTVWEEAGGLFILHTSAEDSLAELKQHRPEWFS
jgi:hypothetical protein